MLVLPSGANAYVSDWVPFNHETDLKTIVSQRVDTALKLALIREAKNTLDIASYDERCDVAFTRPVLTALRDAANRGVKVRFLVSWLGQKLYDNCGRQSTREYLLEVPTTVPIDYIIFGGDFKGGGWSWFDAIHEKIVIADNRMVLTGGRGWGAYYLGLLDTGFAIRGPLVPLYVERFNAIWQAVQEQVSPVRMTRQHYKPVRHDNFPWSLQGEEQATYENVLAWLTTTYPSTLQNRLIEPGAPRARLLHHDFVAQMNSLGKKRGNYIDISARLNYLSDPIIDEAIEKLATVKAARIFMLNGVTHPRLLTAMLGARARGAEVNVFFNKLEPTEKPLTPMNPTWILSIRDIYSMLLGKIDVWAFAPTGWLQQGIYMPKDQISFEYLHRKLSIFDDTVIFGSHNMNSPSTFGNDELSVEIEDPILAADFAEHLYDDALLTNGQVQDVLQVGRQYKWLKKLRGVIPHAILRSM